MIVKKITIRKSGNEVMSIDDSDICHCYLDLWKRPSERFAVAYQGIVKENVLKHRTGAADVAFNEEDKAIATAFEKKLCIPLYFELLESNMPFYQARQGDSLEYELTFHDYNKVIKSTDEASYTIKNICLEFDMVSDLELIWQT